MDFLLIENPWETYNTICGIEEDNNQYQDNLERIQNTKILRVGFSNYPPAFMYDNEYKNFSGIFYEVTGGY